MTASEERKATGSWALDMGAAGSRSGEGALEITDVGLAAGGTSVEFLDVDSLGDADRIVTLGLFPSGTLTLSQLARRHETFVGALRRARDAARTAGMLAHGIAAPTVFEGSLRQPAPGGEAAFLVFPTHVTVVPNQGDPFQVPFGAVEAIRLDGGSYSVVAEAPGGPFVFGQLARQTDPFFRALSGAREAQARRLSEISGSNLFADGAGVPVSKLDSFDRLLGSWSAPERLEGARTLLAAGDRTSSRIGLVELLDPDGEGLAANIPLPDNVAAFLLVPLGEKVALEILSGPSAATYLFRGGIDAVNRDLQAIHFRRRPLSLTGPDEALAPGRPYRLAFRKLEPLRRLRAATAARIIHSEGWKETLERSLSTPT